MLSVILNITESNSESQVIFFVHLESSKTMQKSLNKMCCQRQAFESKLEVAKIFSICTYLQIPKFFKKEKHNIDIQLLGCFPVLVKCIRLQ